MASTAVAAGSRLAFIDNLRTVIIILVMMVHLSITYGGEGSWYYEESEPDLLSGIVLTVHNAVNQSFFMGCLFLISGYFTPASFDRKGPRRFLIGRLVRLGIPMLFYDLVIHPFMIYWLARNGVVGYTGSFWDWAASYYTSFHIGRGPLWFVEALLLFSLVYMTWRLLAGTTPLRVSPLDHVPNQVNRSFDGADSRPTTVPGNPRPTGKQVCPCHPAQAPSVWSLVILALLLGLASFLVRLWKPIGWAFEPLGFQFPFFPQYIVMFILGIVAYRRQWLTRIPRRTGRSALAFAAAFIFVLLPALMVLGGAVTGDVSRYMGGLHWQALAMALWEQPLGVMLTVGLIVLFRERLNRQGGLSRAASANSYGAYVIHAPVLIVFALAVREIHLYPLLKFALATIIAVPLCFALAALIRQLPGARRIL